MGMSWGGSRYYHVTDSQHMLEIFSVGVFLTILPLLGDSDLDDEIALLGDSDLDDDIALLGGSDLDDDSALLGDSDLDDDSALVGDSDFVGDSNWVTATWTTIVMSILTAIWLATAIWLVILICEVM